MIFLKKKKFNNIFEKIKLMAIFLKTKLHNYNYGTLKDLKKEKKDFVVLSFVSFLK